MAFFDFLHPMAFLFALAIGIFYVYISAPPRRIVYKFPTPDNAGKITYKDDAGKQILGNRTTELVVF